jgi:hypothetical protein
MKSLQDWVVHKRLYGLNFKFKLFYFIQTPTFGTCMVTHNLAYK